MATEYESMLQELLDERRARLDGLLNKMGEGDTNEKVREIASEMRFIEVELGRYRQGMAIFRTKNLPKVGRWGKPDTDSHE